MRIRFHGRILRNLVETARLSGYLSVIVEHRLIIGRLSTESGVGLCRALTHRKRLCCLNRLLRSGLLIAESRLE